MLRPRRRSRQARPILLWLAAVYALIHVATVTWMDRARPGWVDHQYAWNLAELRERQGGSGTALALVMGSSRIVNGFIPAWTDPIELPDGAAAVACNFAHTAGGPLMNLQQLDRLLRDGVSPNWIVLEIMPAMLVHESQTNTRDQAVAGDMPLLARETGLLGSLGRYVRGRFNPFYRYRDEIQGEYLPRWLPAELSPERVELRERRGPRWGGVPAEERPAIIDAAREDYYANVHRFQLLKQSDRALRAFLDLCAARHIQAALLMSPEGTAFRSWYTEESRAAGERYLADVSARYGVPLVDARDWIADDMLFIDSHHLIRPGAELFTRLLESRVLRPLVRGEPLATFTPPAPMIAGALTDRPARQ